MSQILLLGGLFRNTKIKYIPINILLNKSPDWIDGYIMINNKPFYSINSNNDNYIGIKKTHSTNIMMLNNEAIYDNKFLFDFSVKVNLNPNITDSPYSNFFKYY